MTKKLLAIAVAGLSSAALAQSSLTISGVMRVGVESVSAGGATVNNQDMTSRTRATDNGSHIRFAGEEALGNGLTAWFQVESAIGSTDNQGTACAPAPGAANCTTIGTRNTAVGVKGAWGNLFMGKWDVHYDSGNNVDTTNGNDAFSSRAQILNITNGNGAAATATGKDAANIFGGREKNTIGYDSPDFNGFAAKVFYSTQSENVSPNLAAKDSMWAVTPGYNKGPITAFYSYMKLSNAGATAVPAAGASGNNSTGQRVGAAYTFPMGLKIGLVWDRNKIEVADGTASLGALGITVANGGNGGNVLAHSRRERTAWGLPIQYVTGAHRFNVAYAKADDISTDAGTVGDSGARLYVFGYEYSMSRRTSVAVLYSAITNGSNAAYDFRESSANIAGTSGAGLSAGADPRTVQLAVRHAF